MSAISYLKVRNWDKFQHYKDKEGSVPWVKLHTTLLSNYDFLALSELEQGRLMKLWLLAARTGNRIPNDKTWVARQVGARSIDLSLLMERGWLEPVYSDSRETLALAEESRTEESRAEQNGHYDGHEIVSLLASLKDSDGKTEATVRRLIKRHHLTEADVAWARECATGPGVKSSAAVAVAELRKRGEAKGAR